MSWHPHDRDAALYHRTWTAESCGTCGVHPSVWKPGLGGHPNAVVARWEFCRVCELIEAAQEAGPPVEADQPKHGWHLTLTRQPPPERSQPDHGQ